MEQVSGWSEQGGSVVTVPGTQGSGSQRFQQSFRSATVTVRDSSNNLATIYSDDLASPTAKANPFTASSTTGSWSFFTTTGTYTLTFSGGSILAPFSITVNVGLGNAGGVPSYAFASLPTSKTQNAGDLARVTNNSRGLWMDTGTQWSSVSGRVYDVTQFGAKGDGVTNDTSAIQAALTAATTGGEVRFPVGTYLINSALTLASNSVRLTGTSGLLSSTQLKAGSASMTLLNVTGYGAVIDSILFQGFETSSVYGEGTTCTGINFTRGDGSKDIDSKVTNCFFDQLSKCISATGANLDVNTSTFQRSIYGCWFDKIVGEECRGFVVNGNRFHIIGGVSTDGTVAAATAIFFNSTEAFLNQVINNYADDCKFFFDGPVGHGTQVNNNNVERNRNTIIRIRPSGVATERNSGSVTANTLGNLTDDLNNSAGYGIHMDGCRSVNVCGNTIHYIRRHGIWITNSAINNRISDNLINSVNVGYTLDGTIYDGIAVDAGSVLNHISDNRIMQQLAGGMQYGIDVAGDNCYFWGNAVYKSSGNEDFFNLSTTINAWGSTACSYYAGRQQFGNAAPAAGKWFRGDIVWNFQPAAGFYTGWICLTSGTPGTWAPFGQTGVVDNTGSTPFYVGQIAVTGGNAFIAIAATAAGDWKQIT